MLIESTGVYDRIFDIYKDALHLIDTIDRTNDLQTIRAHAFVCKDNISDYLYALESLPFDEDETCLNHCRSIKEKHDRIRRIITKEKRN